MAADRMMRTLLFALLASLLPTIAVAQKAPAKVIVDDATYFVVGDAVTDDKSVAITGTPIADKALFTARILDTEILNSESNRGIYSALSRAAVFADAASKDWVEPWRDPLIKAAALPNDIGGMVAEAQALADAKRAFAAWVAKLADNPRELAIAIARRDYMDGVRAFRENSAIYRKVTVKNGILTHEEALRFQQNQYLVLRMAYARALEEELQRGTAAAPAGPGETPAAGQDGRSADQTASSDQATQDKAGEHQKSLKDRLNSEVAGGVEEVKSVAELESKFDDMRKVVESDASGLTQTRELKDYVKTTQDLRRATEAPIRSGEAVRIPADVPAADRTSPTFQIPAFNIGPYTQRFAGTFQRARPTRVARYNVNPIVAAQMQRRVVWPRGTNTPPQSDITGLKPRQETFTGRYQPITRAKAQTVVGKYRSIPGGITLEGGSSDLGFVKSVAYIADVNAFILNDDVVYLNPVGTEEFLEIAQALAADDKLGVSIGSVLIVYGKLPPKSVVARNLRLADNFLGGIAFGEASRTPGYVFAPGFQNAGQASGNIAVYFNLHDVRFVEDPSGELRRGGLAFDVTLVPLTNQRAADGGHGPDFNRIEKGDVPKAFVSNVNHLQANLEYYARERIIRTTFAYSEVAAFARSLKENGVRMGTQAR